MYNTLFFMLDIIMRLTLSSGFRTADRNAGISQIANNSQKIKRVPEERTPYTLFSKSRNSARPYIIEYELAYKFNACVRIKV